MIKKIILKLFFALSATICSYKINNKYISGLMQFLYLILISIGPLLFLSFYMTMLFSQNNVEFCNIFRNMLGGTIICITYITLININSKRKIAEYILVYSLIFKAYRNGKKKIKNRVIKIMLEYFIFGFLFITLYRMLIVMIEYIGIQNMPLTIPVCRLSSLFITYVLFVYGSLDKQKRKEKKAYIGIGITIIWIVVFGLQFCRYITGLVVVTKVDIAIFVITGIFTIPTICDWTKEISEIIFSPYQYIAFKEYHVMIEKYSYQKLVKIFELKHKKIKNECKEIVGNIKDEWKNGNKKLVVKKLAYCLISILFVILIFISCHWLSNKVPILKEIINIWYENLNVNIRANVEKGMTVTIFIFVILVILFKGLKSIEEKNIMEKIKIISTFIIVEMAFIYTTVMVLVH